MSSWFELISDDESLYQGDIIEKCKILLPTEEHYHALLTEASSSLELSYTETDCIIMSQSCDLVNAKIKFAILCPIIPLAKLVEKDAYYKSRDSREQLRQGNQPSYHLLDKITLNTVEDYFCVSFHHIFSVPKDFLIASVKGKTRLRLVSPYKEHLSQSFARYFMRVGLPATIDQKTFREYSVPSSQAK